MFDHLGDYGRKSAEDMIIRRLCDSRFLQADEVCRSTKMDYNIGLRVPREPSNKTFTEKLEPGMKRREDEIEKGIEYGEGCPYWTNWEQMFTRRGPMNYPVSVFSHLLFGQSWNRVKFQVRDRISKTFKRVLKSLTNNVDEDKRLIEEAVDTVFGFPTVNVFEFLELYVRAPSYENKVLLKMVLEKYISNHLTADRVTCYLQELTRNKLLDDHILDDGPDRFNLQNFAVKWIINATVSVLEEHGTVPYIDLANVLVDELYNLNIPDIMHALYRNSVKLQQFEESVDWNEEFDKFKNSTKPLQKVLEALYCTSDGKLGSSEIAKKIFRNIYAVSSDEDLNHNIKGFFNVPLTAMRYFIELRFDEWRVKFDAGKWLSMNPLFITNLIKENKGSLKKLLNYEIDASDVRKVVGETVQELLNLSSVILHNHGILENISYHLFKGISLTAEEKKNIEEPLKEFKTSFECVYCNFMENVFQIKGFMNTEKGCVSY